MKILVVIPARGGSKRIPGKNLRLMNGKPLVLYSLENAAALETKYDVDVAVSTDDEELSSIVRDHCTRCLMRSEELCRDDVTLDPVIYDALIRMEEERGVTYDCVITMQPTSPTLKPETLRAAVKFFAENDFDTVISAVNRPHLSWTKDKEGNIVKNYIKRINSQELPPNFLETGGFVIARRAVVTKDTRIGEKVTIYEVPGDEAVDIDTDEDWIVAEAVLKRKRILFRIVGKAPLGTGHIYRSLTLARAMIGNTFLFVTDSESNIGIEKLKESCFPYRAVEDDREYEEVLKEFKPDIVINDLLDTKADFVLMERKYAHRIVNFEDEGEGAAHADVVINALYERHAHKLSNVYEGSDYYFIRDEFLDAPPKDFSEECGNIVILFGGSDPSNLTMKLYEICQVLHPKMPHTSFNFITGIGYAHKEQVRDIPDKNIFVHHNVKRVSDFLRQADLAVTSQGRTIYELACMGVPAIVLSQNEREAEHVFAGIQNGFINLGLGRQTDAITIIKTIQWLTETPNVRRQMRSVELEKEFSKGRQRVLDLIMG